VQVVIEPTKIFSLLYRVPLGYEVCLIGSSFKDFSSRFVAVTLKRLDVMTVPNDFISKNQRVVDGTGRQRNARVNENRVNCLSECGYPSEVAAYMLMTD
jgi:hypothetical protein